MVKEEQKSLCTWTQSRKGRIIFNNYSLLHIVILVVYLTHLRIFIPFCLHLHEIILVISFELGHLLLKLQ